MTEGLSHLVDSLPMKRKKYTKLELANGVLLLAWVAWCVWAFGVIDSEGFHWRKLAVMLGVGVLGLLATVFFEKLFGIGTESWFSGKKATRRELNEDDLR